MITNRKQPVRVIAKNMRRLYKPYGKLLRLLFPPVYLGGFAPPAGQVGIAYNYDLSPLFTGADSYAADVLPAGLDIVGSAITGTPTTAEAPLVTVTAINDDGSAATPPATLTVTL